MRSPARTVRDVVLAVRELQRPATTPISPEAMWRLGRVGIAGAIVVANVVGAVVVVALTFFVIPLPDAEGLDGIRVENAVVASCYVVVAVLVGIRVGIRRMHEVRDWLGEDRPATDHEKRVLLQAPMRLFNLQVSFWLGAALLFGVLNGRASVRVGFWIAVVVALTGVTTAASAYLLIERLLRPAAARALADGTTPTSVPGVALRTLLSWALGTAIPVLGLFLIGVVTLATGEHTAGELGVAMVALAGTALVVGAFVVFAAARATADPIRSVRAALDAVRVGDYEVRVPVYDGTEIGQLQLGFNQMAAGLAERERIRAVFGTYVDAEVADHILSHGTDLAGEEVEVTVLFLDIRDFTGFAERTTAPEVVAAINRLFSIVVPIIGRHGGRVDKFVGDGLLAVWGAPERLADHATRALDAALDIERALLAAGEPLQVGIGINSGVVVAGNVGGAGRLEFSVIGDAVNVASRVEAATRRTGDTILLTSRTRELLDGTAPALVERPGIELKGKSGTASLYAPSA